ncbi:MAG: helix-turn-helix transcriptional regulator [Eubacteriales bacterium]|nr:helix-turn-helix transcriptional regulator [Eubacteriales bacterium]
MRAFTEKLLYLRKKQGLTQEALSKALFIERPTYTNYERGRRVPPYEIIVRIADFYNVSLDYLLREDYELYLSHQLTIIDKILSVLKQLDTTGLEDSFSHVRYLLALQKMHKKRTGR